MHMYDARNYFEKYKLYKKMLSVSISFSFFHFNILIKIDYYFLNKNLLNHL